MDKQSVLYLVMAAGKEEIFPFQMVVSLPSAWTLEKFWMLNP